MTPPSRRPPPERHSPAPDAPGETTPSAGGTARGKDQVERRADAVAAAVRGCSAVARLAAGPVATYLPGRLVPGVAIRGGDVTVAVVARYGPPLPQVAADVRAAVRRVDPELRVEVMIEDIDLPASGTRP
jgi:hypothetical protein